MYTPDDHVPALTPFIDGEVWTAKAPLRFLGIPMGCRMTVCRLEGGGLLVHSPIALDHVEDELRALEKTYGPVRYAIAPNFIHHLYMSPFLEAFPDARLFISPGLVKRRPDLKPEAVLTDAAPDETWGSTLEQAACKGSFIMDEVVFFHRPSRTLILCDLCQCMHENAPVQWRTVGRVMGVYERYGPARDLRLSFRDKGALRDFVERVLDWDFDRIVLSHGNLVERGGKDTFRDAYAFCLD